MPIVDAKCTNCGQTLKIDNSKEAAICEFCGSAFIVEKAINNYNISLQIAHANIKVDDTHSIEKKLENAEVFFKQLNQPEKAKSLFKEVTNDDPSNYKGWWGIVRIMTNEFTNKSCSEPDFKEIEQYATNAINVAPVDIKNELVSSWENAKVIYANYIKTQNDTIDKLNTKLWSLKSELQNNNDMLAQTQNHFIDSRLPSSLYYCMLIGYIASIITYLLYKYAIKHDYPNEADTFLVITIIAASFSILITIISILAVITRKLAANNKTIHISELNNKKNDLNKEIQNLQLQINEIKNKLSKE